MALVWTVRIHASGDRPAPSTERTFGTKREALTFIKRLGALSLISKAEPHTYSVRVKPKK